MNLVAQIGRLTAEPEIRRTQSGTAVAYYTLAVDRVVRKEGQPTADFFDCVAWQSNAEFVQKYLHKGMKIGVTGRLQSSSYEKDGVKRSKVEIIVDHHDFCESKSGGASSCGTYAAPQPQQGFREINDDDGELPF